MNETEQAIATAESEADEYEMAMARFARLNAALVDLRRNGIHNSSEFDVLRDGLFANLPGVIVGQVIMQALDPLTDSLYNEHVKKLWIDIAKELGPDFIPELEKVVRWIRITNDMARDRTS